MKTNNQKNTEYKIENFVSQPQFFPAANTERNELTASIQELTRILTEHNDLLKKLVAAHAPINYEVKVVQPATNLDGGGIFTTKG